jgi:hypothetical protein
MQPGGIVCIILFSSVLLAGCTYLPGFHVISDTPDPLIGQWIGGEPPASEMHMVFYENLTFYSVNFFINRGEETDTGTWAKIERGHYSTHSVTGETTNWTYDSFGDSLYIRNLPQKQYYRYKV